MKINEQKLRSVMSLPGPERYSHFIKVAADQRCVWGLFRDGWALAESNEGQLAFPLWPAMLYAEQCTIGEWRGYEVREIDLDTLFEVLLPKLKASSVLAAIFPTPNEKGVVPELGVLEADLRGELARIE
jgi:hypothetical protein